MGDIFLNLLNRSIAAGWLILAVLLLRLLLKRTPRWIHCLLWGIVAVRLACPFSVESVCSLVPRAETVHMNMATGGRIYGQIPSANGNMSVVDNMDTSLPGETVVLGEEESASPLQVWLNIVGIIWGLGVLLMAAYAVVSHFRIRHMVKEAVCHRDRIYFCDAVTSPFISGIVRPRIYLPSGMDKGMIPHVTAHEQAHLKRKDHWWKPLGYLLLTVYWFQPLCWAAYLFFGRDIEFACDEKVIKDMTLSEKKEYSRALLFCSSQRRTVLTCPLAFGEISVKDRVKSILDHKKAAFWVLAAAVAVCIVVAVCFLTDPPRKLQIQATAPVVRAEELFDSNAELSFKGTGTLYEGEGLPDEGADGTQGAEVYGENSEETTPQKYGMGDLDGNGEEEYLLIQNPKDSIFDGHLSFYFNGESIYEYDDVLAMHPGEAEYIDLDRDGKEEIFFTFYPYVNSAPLVEYAVLKQTADGWRALEMIHGEDMLDNAFPIVCRHGSGKYSMVITCEGLDKQIVYDYEAHYKAYIEEFQGSDMENVYAEVLERQYEEGDEFGGVAGWGVWEIVSDVCEGRNCLVATHGLLGKKGNWDYMGDVDIYFDYDADGLVNILDMRFRDYPLGED